MKQIIEFFNDQQIIFNSFEKVEPKELGSRKKIEIYDGLEINKSYHCVFKIDSKSRFIRKNALDLLELFEKLITIKDHNYKFKTLLISSPICSKSKALLTENGWKVFEVVL